jgi:lambda family phage portal protein
MAKGKVVPFQEKPQTRQWQAAKVSTLHSDWVTYSRPIDVDIRNALPILRARARELVQNSDHGKGFIRMVRNNIVGPQGFRLQARCLTPRGKPDLKTRTLLEGEFNAWSQRSVCEISGKFSFRALQRHVIETVALDGEAFLRVIRDPGVNAWGYALQVIDPEAVDINYNGEHAGNLVRMGVEVDQHRRPVAYWVFGEGGANQGSYRIGDRFRIPAEDMIHVYLPEFCWQTRGVPWLAVALSRIHMIQGTEDAEVTAARASACKIGVYEAQPDSVPPPVTTDAAGNQLVDAAGNPISSDQGRFSQDMAPGTYEVVPYGYNLKLLDPQHPNSAMPDFLKWALRSVGTGLGVSYNALGNDAEGVNYTSLRYFLGLERDHWLEMQDWFESDFVERVRHQWRDSALLIGRLPGENPKWDQVYWQARRWEGPDPAKQAQADEMELKIGSTTLNAILSRKGLDFDDHVQERINELASIRDAAEAAGLTLIEVLPYLQKTATAAPAPQDPNA